jgi:hypothetical protein
MRGISMNVEHRVLDSNAAQPGNGQHLARMTGAALERLLEQHGLPPGLAWDDVAEITTPDMNLPLNASDEQTAQELALALYWVLVRIR